MRQDGELPSGKDTRVVVVTAWGQEVDGRSSAAGIEYRFARAVAPAALKTLLATFEERS